ncbi:hypothetical protein G7Y89_g4193 [Cudoniella acicularis]|uniref:Heterokaryon incompatibility domain-containing protein n=1 Tax=Cudoniella acicularis TaxID=354080 RepID=A0A8H4RPY4_9HELO|nr:hypothetical protein G7Y89_g4193 [Cudoniella acicularis]
MAIENDANFVCPVCFNLDFGRLPEIDPPCTLDEYRISTPFSEIKASAESSDCLACGIICSGLENMREQWEGSEFLRDSTLLIMHLRHGYNLRITLANVGYEGVLDFYTLSHEDNGSIPAFGISRAVASKPDLRICLALAAKWMKKCNEGHILCSRPVDSRLPTRIIDVGLDEESDTVYLKETRDSDRDPYMSLSHCWGKEQIITTTTNTLQGRKAGIKISELPRTFRHAIRITRGLGIRYLWIDSLCIIQDDRKDWEIESAKMADVYMGSQLNLAATHSSNGKGGCFAERWSLDTLGQFELNVGKDAIIEPDDNEEGNYKIFVRNALHVAHDHFTRTMDYAHTMESASPLLTRGWVFQERLLSLRTLHFHAEELIWECASGISCECSRLEDYQWGDPDGLLQQRSADQLKMMYTSISSSTATESQILDIWLEIVTEYCTLKLTKQMDRLPAISGLASRVARRLSGEYLQNKHPSFRDAHASAPSWSWASVWNHSDDVSNITYGLVSVRGFVVDPRCKVQGFHRPRSLTNSFGICGDVWLKIRAPLVQATFFVTESAMDSAAADWAHENNLSQYMRKTVIRNNIEFDQESVIFSGDCFDTEGRLTDISHGDSVFCLLLGHFKHSEKDLMSQYPPQYLTRAEKLKSEDLSSQIAAAYALVLVKADGGSAYRRAGLLVHRRGSGWWEGADIRDITLI